MRAKSFRPTGVYRGGEALATVLGLMVMSFGLPCFAQLASDEVPHERTLPLSEEIREQLESSRFRFGIFRLQPRFAIRDLGYDNNVFGTATDPVSDWHSSVAAGTSFIVPAGSKLYLRGDAVPEYTYYRKITSRRSLGGDYGASILGLFNHMTIEAGGHSKKSLENVSSELERPAIGTRSDVTGTLELDIFQRLSVFGTGIAQQQRYRASEADEEQGLFLNTLERNETLVRGGFRYRPVTFFDISIAAEKTRSLFKVNRDRDNASTALILGIQYDRPRSFLNLSAGARRGDALDTAAVLFPHYSTVTGSYYAEHELGSHLVIDAYGHRGIAYSLTVENPFFLETRNGGGIWVPVGSRLAFRAFGEAGTNAYPVPIGSQHRTDDASSYGGGFAMRLYRNLVLTAIGEKTNYVSTIADNNRSVFRFTTVVSAQTNLFR